MWLLWLFKILIPYLIDLVAGRLVCLDGLLLGRFESERSQLAYVINILIRVHKYLLGDLSGILGIRIARLCRFVAIGWCLPGLEDLHEVCLVKVPHIRVIVASTLRNGLFQFDAT